MQHPLFSFGIVADLQYGDLEPWENRYFRNSPLKLAQAVDFFNRRNPAFLVDLGDVIDRGWEYFDGILPIYRRIDCPVHMVAGNHDFEVSSEKKPLVLSRLGIGRGWYSFTRDSWRFIVLNGADVSTFAFPAGHPSHVLAESWIDRLNSSGAQNGNPWNGGIGPEQLTWLREELDKASGQGQRTAVFCHYPVYPEHRHNLLNDTELIHLLERYDHLVAWFCGHNHDGNYGIKNGIHYVTFRGMVETEAEPAFCLVHVYDDRLELEGFGREPSRRLNLFASSGSSGSQGQTDA